MTVGERMKARRKELKISADTVAEKLGVSRSTIFRYEKGEIEKLPTNMLEDIADVLNTTPAYLMGWNQSIHDITSVYSKLNKDRQTKVYEFAEHQLEEQNKIVELPSREKRLEVLAAHIDDDMTEEEMDEIKAFIDSLRDED